MKLKPLYEGQKYKIVCVTDGDSYPVEDFLASEDANIKSYVEGLRDFIAYAADHGLEKCPSKWYHEANKQNKIYEFIKGPMRLFFFKGDGDTIAVCTGYTRKSGDKADKTCVEHASTKRIEYFSALEAGTIEFIEE